MSTRALLLVAASCLALAGRVAAADKSSARPNVISVPKGPGSLEGLGESFEANLNSGSVREAVRITVPPGTGGLAPQLALTYDSGQGNGPLGVGWSLGISTIQVQTERGLPRYDVTDRFLLDGAELVEVSAGVYRQKNEGRFVRVRRTGTSWEVDSPDGMRARYGLTAPARVESGGAVFSWALEEVEDRFGNRIVYGYLKDGEQPYLAQVDYNARAGAAQNQVLLQYEPRPDPATDRRARFPVTTALRLARVDVLGQGSLVRRYRLAYSTENGLSQLASVTQLGRDGATALPPVRFWYQPHDSPAQAVAVPESGEGLPGPGAGNDELIDLDGDGLVDLVHAEAGAHWWSPNRGAEAGFGPRVDMPWSPSVSLGSPNVEVADLDGDGLPDLVARLGLTQAEWHWFAGTGQGGWGPDRVFTSNPPFKLEDPNVKLMDFDHDKLVDAVQSGAGVLVLWRNGGDGTWQGPFEEPAPAGFPSLGFADPHLRLADVTGDRLLDLVYVLDGSITVWASLGWGRFAAPVELGDSPAPGPLAEPELQVVDVNGDGLADLLWVAVDHVEWWPLLAGGSYGGRRVIEGTPLRDPATTVIRLVDLNGNGTTDVVWSTPSAPGGERLWSLDLVGEAKPGVLVGVENGLGKRVALRYTTSTAEFLRARAEGRPWATRVPFAVPVLAEVVVSDGRGSAHRTSYAYRDGWYAPATREFRGFAEAVRVEAGDADEATSVEVHAFHLGEAAEALKGRPVRKQLRMADGTVLTEEAWSWAPRAYAAGLAGTPCAGAELRTHARVEHDGVSPPARAETTYQYDTWGNVLEERALGLVDAGDPRAGDDERFTSTTYATDEASWLLRPVSTVTVRGGAGERLAEARHYYDGDPMVGLPAGQATRGALTRKEVWVEGGRFVQAVRQGYDEYGNVVARLSAGGLERTVVLDATHRFPVEERVAWLAGDLVWRATYDPATGDLLSSRDANGATVSATYDALGRVVAIVQPGDTAELPTERFEYRLGDPVSALVTWKRLHTGQAATVESRQFFDGLGRKLRAVVRGDGGWHVSGASVFTPRGRVARQFQPFLGAEAESPPPAAAAFDAWAYDEAGRITRHRLADGAVSRSVYRVLETDEYDADPAHADLPRTTRVDGQGRRREVVERVRQAGQIRALRTLTDVDAQGRIVRTVDPAGHERRLSYDGLGNLALVQDPDAGERRYRYDDDGNLLLTTSEHGSIQFTHDLLGRPVREVATDVLGVAEVRYHYDAAPAAFPGATGYLGRLAWVEDAGGIDALRYDERGRRAAHHRTVAGSAFTETFAHDAGDQLRLVGCPDGQVVEYRRDSMGRVVGIPGVVERIAYTPQGSLQDLTLANGVSEALQYDARLRLARHRVVGPGGVLRDAAFSYDPLSNLVGVDDAAGESARYAFDELSRLVSATVGERASTYAYADDGNLDAADGRVASYGSGRPHALTGLGADQMGYGPGGALESWGGRQARYDAYRRLRSVTLPGGGEVRLTYDFGGRLIAKASPEGQVLYPTPTFEVDGTGGWCFVQLGDRRIARLGRPGQGSAGAVLLGLLGLAGAGAAASLLASRRRAWRRLIPAVAAAAACTTSSAPAGRSVRYYHRDLPGSVRFTTDEVGQRGAVMRYAPFGQPLDPPEERELFAAREYDAATGLSLHPERALHTGLGRWTVPDLDAIEHPDRHAARPQGLNPYAYAVNNPVSYKDATGRFEEPIHGALTYRLALAAGFSQQQAAQIAVGSAGVDYSKATEPTSPLNIFTGVTEFWHFNPNAPERVNALLTPSLGDNLYEFGRRIHALEDAGWRDAPGPHVNGLPVYLPSVWGSTRVGHPLTIYPDGAGSAPWNHHADHPFHNPEANRRVLERVARELYNAATLSAADFSKVPSYDAFMKQASAEIGKAIELTSKTAVTNYMTEWVGVRDRYLSAHPGLYTVGPEPFDSTITDDEKEAPPAVEMYGP